MTRIIISLLVFSVIAAASPGSAATMIYNTVDGTAKIDPTDRGVNPQGIVHGYYLRSEGKFFADPVRMSAFPPPSPTFFRNTADEIGDNDLTLQGTRTIINLGQLFTVKPQTNQEVIGNFIERYFVSGLSVEQTIPIVFVSEPTSVAATGLALLSVLASRRRRNLKRAAAIQDAILRVG